MATGKSLRKKLSTRLASLRKSKKKGSKVVTRSSEMDMPSIEEAPRKGLGKKQRDRGKSKTDVLMSERLSKSRNIIKGLSKRLFRKSKKKGLARSDTTNKLETIATTSSVAEPSDEGEPEISTLATKEMDLEGNSDWSRTPPPSLIEVSNVKNKVLKPPILATSNVPLLVVESEPTEQTGALKSAPLRIEVVDEENGLLENAIAVTNSLSLPVMDSALNTKSNSDNEDVVHLSSTHAVVKFYREEEGIKRILTAMDTLFLPVMESKSKFEASSDKELTWFQQLFVSCRGGEEDNKIGVLS